ncbi:MAG: glycoside hydrolase [Bacteroidota bacterium]
MKSLKAAYLIFLLLLSVPLSAQVITIDPNVQYQIIEHFGASDAWRMQFVGKNWPLEKRERIADLLFSREMDEQGNPKGIGLSLWRFYIGSGSAHQGDSSDIKNEWRRGECFLKPDGTYDWSRQEGQRWFLEAAKKRGVEKYLAFTLSAPVQYTINGKAYSIKEDERINLKSGHYEDYAKFTVDVLEHFANEGYEFDYFSPVNEPQWDWSNPGQEGTAATNENIYLLSKYISEELESRDLNTKLTVGEVGDIKQLYINYKASGDQVDAFFGEDAVLNLSSLPKTERLITGHSYFTTWPIDTLVNTRKKLRAKLDEVDDLGYWQTEFCILEASPEIGNGHKRDLGMNTALYVARVIHADLTITNASSWQWWTSLTTWDFKDGLIYLDTGDESDLFNRDRMKNDGEVRESKLLWALGNFSRFVTPGMTRIEADVDHEQMAISAFKAGEKCVMVVINHSQKAQKLSLPQEFTPEKSYLTDEKNSLNQMTLGGKSIKLPKRSVMTLVGKVNT